MHACAAARGACGCPAPPPVHWPSAAGPCCSELLPPAPRCAPCRCMLCPQAAARRTRADEEGLRRIHLVVRGVGAAGVQLHQQHLRVGRLQGRHVLCSRVAQGQRPPAVRRQQAARLHVRRAAGGGARAAAPAAPQRACRQHMDVAKVVRGEDLGRGGEAGHPGIVHKGPAGVRPRLRGGGAAAAAAGVRDRAGRAAGAAPRVCPSAVSSVALGPLLFAVAGPARTGRPPHLGSTAAQGC